MKEHFIIDPLISKRQQLLLATQLCRMVLKVCIKSLYCIGTSRMLRRRPLAVLFVRVTALPLLQPLLLFELLPCRGSGEAVHGMHTRRSALQHVTRGKCSLCFACCNTGTPCVDRPGPCMPSPVPCVTYMPSCVILTSSIGQQCYHCWKRRARLLNVNVDEKGQIKAMPCIAS